MQVIDFGSSCYENQRVYTYIQSRFYRAPEVILGVKYGMAIDMWSLGCILAELYTGYALLPGEDEADQLACIIEMLGMPPKKLLDQSKRAKNFISAKGYPRYCSVETLDDGTIKLGPGLSRRGKERRPPGTKELRTALKGLDDHLFLHFLRCCLEWDPDLRMTPAMALKHPWFRRRLPRPPHFSGTENDATPAENGKTSSGASGGIVNVHLPSQQSNNGASATTDSIATSINSAVVHQQLPLQQHSMSTSTPSRSSNQTMSVHPSNGANGSGTAAATTNKLRVHLSSSDESMLSYTNRSTTSSVHSTHRVHNHVPSNSTTTKLPQIQQGNTTVT